MALSADKDAKRADGKLKEFSTYQSTTIYKGGMVCINSTGYAIAGANTSGLKFVGIAYEKCDNSTGSSGDKYVRVEETGEFEMNMTGASIAHVGIQAYLVDDTTVASTASNSVKCGKITEYVSSGVVRVKIDVDANAGI